MDDLTYEKSKKAIRELENAIKVEKEKKRTWWGNNKNIRRFNKNIQEWRFNKKIQGIWIWYFNEKISVESI